MSPQDRVAQDNDRARRLLEFVKGELREMWVGSRMRFTVEIFTYLTPEIEVLLKEDKIKVPNP